MNARNRLPTTALLCLPLMWFGCTTTGPSAAVLIPPKMAHATGVPASLAKASLRANGETPPAGPDRTAPAGGSYTLTSGEMLSELMGIHGVPAGAVDLNDTVYVVPSQEWVVREFLPHFARFRSGLSLQHRGEGLDCDNFAAFFRNQLVLANLATGRERNGDVPCGILKVQQKEAFGAVPALGDGFHSLILLRTEAGWLVVEPQDNSVVPLFEYPNRNRIAFAYF